MTDASPLDDTPSPTPRPRRRRWPLGTLTLIVTGFVAIGLVLLADDDPAATTITTPSGFDIPPHIIGNAAPDFTIDLLDGSRFDLSDHLACYGRPVLLNLWASWCAPCREEMPALDAASRTHTDVYFIGVAVEDDPAAAAAFAAEVAVSYPLAIDESGEVGRDYPSPGLPATFLISPDGIIVKTVYGGLDEADIDAMIADAFGL
ncbi:MAG: TlpA family protein disulfide reductase [Acidimicrobiia bacterium]|nr:TlpA family protein disulfide reductase [Acidimicrobiia bacterium]